MTSQERREAGLTLAHVLASRSAAGGAPAAAPSAEYASSIEGTNAAHNRWHGCGRALYRNIERVMNQITMGILAYNLTRAVALQRGECA